MLEAAFMHVLHATKPGMVMYVYKVDSQSYSLVVHNIYPYHE